MIVLDKNFNIISKYAKKNWSLSENFYHLKRFLNSIGLKKITPGYASFSKGIGESIINLKFDIRKYKYSYFNLL